MLLQAMQAIPFEIKTALTAFLPTTRLIGTKMRRDIPSRYRDADAEGEEEKSECAIGLYRVFGREKIFVPLFLAVTA